MGTMLGLCVAELAWTVRGIGAVLMLSLIWLFCQPALPLGASETALVDEAGGRAVLTVPSARRRVARPFGVPEARAISGPFEGVLQDGSGRPWSRRQDTSTAEGWVPLYVTMDAMCYDGKAAWPQAADGDGPLRQSLAPTAYSDDPAN